MKTIKLSEVKCGAFQSSGPVEFLKAGGDQGRFRIVGYTGAPVERSWGKLIIDLAGIKAKPALPVLLGHDHAKIVGHSERTAVEKGLAFIVDGIFSQSTEAAKEVKALAKEGFPWQASIGVMPRQAGFVEAGKSLIVNGRNVEGPVEVWTKSEVFETSFVTLGADTDTSVDTFASGQKRTENLLRDLWAADPSLRLEFGEFEIFEAFMANKDRITIIGGKCQLYSAEDFQK